MPSRLTDVACPQIHLAAVASNPMLSFDRGLNWTLLVWNIMSSRRSATRRCGDYRDITVRECQKPKICLDGRKLMGSSRERCHSQRHISGPAWGTEAMGIDSNKDTPEKWRACYAPDSDARAAAVGAMEAATSTSNTPHTSNELEPPARCLPRVGMEGTNSLVAAKYSMETSRA